MALNQDFWDQEHRRVNQTWLTGSLLSYYNNFFHLTSDDYRDRRILEIGVGMGRATKELSELADTLYCADISSVALDRISSLAQETFLTKDIAKIPAVDLVICHLVLVHCEDRECQRIINAVNLAPGGRFYVQFSGPGPDGISPRAQAEFVDNGSHFFRTMDQIQDLVDFTNKRIETHIGTANVNHADWFQHQWHALILTAK